MMEILRAMALQANSFFAIKSKLVNDVSDRQTDRQTYTTVFNPVISKQTDGDEIHVNFVIDIRL